MAQLSMLKPTVDIDQDSNSVFPVQSELRHSDGQLHTALSYSQIKLDREKP